MNTAIDLNSERPHPGDGSTHTLSLRAATAGDLGAINRVIASALGTWGLSDRVKRLCLPVYQYDAHDLDHLDMIVAERRDGEISAIATMEPDASVAELPDCRLALLHGLYVDPLQHGQGLGRHLLAEIQSLATRQHYNALLVKANPAATTFFEHCGFEHLPVNEPAVDYPYRYIKALSAETYQPGPSTYWRRTSK